MTKKIATVICCALLSVSLFAQEVTGYSTSGNGGGDRPSAGGISVEVAFGYQSVFTPKMVTSYKIPSQGSSIYPNIFVYTALDNIEMTSSLASTLRAKYYIVDALAIRVGGGFHSLQSPGKDDVPGVPSVGGSGGVSYVAEVDQMDFSSYFVEGGLEFHFLEGAFSPYTGATYAYGFSQMQETMVARSSIDNFQMPDLGPRKSEIYSHSVALLFGFEYYITDNFYAGVETRIANYTFGEGAIMTAPGGQAGAAKINEFQLISLPLLKAGLQF